MASKKDFSGVNVSPVYNTIADATAEPVQETQQAQEEQDTKQRKARRTYTEEEKQGYRWEGKTQGRKGIFKHRINMGFSDEIHEYIKTMARARGEDMTVFCNAVFQQHMEENRDKYEQAKEMIKAFKGTFD